MDVNFPSASRVMSIYCNVTQDHLNHADHHHVAPETPNTDSSTPSAFTCIAVMRILVMKSFIKLEKTQHSHFTYCTSKGKVHILVAVAAQPLFYSVFHPFSSILSFMWSCGVSQII